MRLFNRGITIPVLRFTGPIGMATPLRPGLSLATAAEPIERAFADKSAPAVAVIVNSPGGSPVQSRLIADRIRKLSEEKTKPVYVFAEDVMASGGYLMALCGDEIYADESSIVGSIGVITSGFGLDKAIERLGIERRVYTAGTQKMSLDPFQPEKADDVARLKALQREVHDAFIALVKERRGGPAQGQRRGAVPGRLLVGPARRRAGPRRWAERCPDEDAVALRRQGEAQARQRRARLAPAPARPVATATAPAIGWTARASPRRRCRRSRRGRCGRGWGCRAGRASAVTSMALCGPGNRRMRRDEGKQNPLRCGRVLAGPLLRRAGPCRNPHRARHRQWRLQERGRAQEPGQRCPPHDGGADQASVSR